MIMVACPLLVGNNIWHGGGMRSTERLWISSKMLLIFLSSW